MDAHIVRYVDRGVAIATDWAYRQAIEYSSGPYSQEILDDNDNPYAKRHAHEIFGFPLHIINVQTGEFRSGWRARSYRSGYVFIGKVWNYSYISETLEHGDEFMKARPLVKVISNYMSVRGFSPTSPMMGRFDGKF